MQGYMMGAPASGQYANQVARGPRGGGMGGPGGGIRSSYGGQQRQPQGGGGGSMPGIRGGQQTGGMRYQVFFLYLLIENSEFLLIGRTSKGNSTATRRWRRLCLLSIASSTTTRRTSITNGRSCAGPSRAVDQPNVDCGYSSSQKISLKIELDFSKFRSKNKCLVNVSIHWSLAIASVKIRERSQVN
jgi:hypothetical protein